MHDLGYTRYVAQGGDVGAAVTDAMGRQAPEGLLGIHMNLLVTVLAGPQPTESEEERAAADQLATFRESGFGYFLEMATRPQTIGYALLLDSPVALAAWLLDHDTDSYYKITNAFVDGEPVGNLTREHIVDNITLYWLTGTGASAARLPGKTDKPWRKHASGQAPPEVSLPVGFTTFPGEIWRTRAAGSTLPQRHVLQRGRQGRALRRVGRARALLGRDASGVQVTACDGGPSPVHPTHRRPAGRRSPPWIRGGDRLAQHRRSRRPVCAGTSCSSTSDVHVHQLAPHARLRPRVGEKYADRGLVVVGVHTPEFPFERDVDNVRWAAEDLTVEYPIALDSDYSVWRASTTIGRPCTSPMRKDESDTTSSRADAQSANVSSSSCCTRPDATASVTTSSPSPTTVSRHKRTGPTWSRRRPTSRHEQAQNFASPGGAGLDEPRACVAPDRLKLNRWALSGNWTIERGRSVLNEADGRIAFPSTLGTSISSWGPVPEARRCRSACSSTGNLPAPLTASTSTKTVAGQWRSSGSTS